MPDQLVAALKVAINLADGGVETVAEDTGRWTPARSGGSTSAPAAAAAARSAVSASCGLRLRLPSRLRRDCRIGEGLAYADVGQTAGAFEIVAAAVGPPQAPQGT